MEDIKKLYGMFENFVISSSLGYDIVSVIEANLPRYKWEERGILNSSSVKTPNDVTRKYEKVSFWRMERNEPWVESFRFPIGELELVCVELLNGQETLYRDNWGSHHYKAFLDAAVTLAKKKGLKGKDHYYALSEPQFSGAGNGSSLALVHFYVRKRKA